VHWHVINKNERKIEIRIDRWSGTPEDVEVRLFETELRRGQTGPEDPLAVFNGSINRNASAPRFTFTPASLPTLQSISNDDSKAGDFFKFRFQGQSDFVTIPVLKDPDEPHEIVYDIGFRIFAGGVQRFPPNPPDRIVTQPVAKTSPVLVCVDSGSSARPLDSVVFHFADFTVLVGSTSRTFAADIEGHLSDQGKLIFYDGKGRTLVTDDDFSISAYPFWANGTVPASPGVPTFDSDDPQNFHQLGNVVLGSGNTGPLDAAKRFRVMVNDSTTPSEPMQTVESEAESSVDPANFQDRWRADRSLTSPSLPAGTLPLLRIDEPGAMTPITHNGHDLRFRRKFGYGTFNKCNIFALDMCWRSGIKVPVFRLRNVPNHTGACDSAANITNHHVLSYPNANSLTRIAEDARENDRTDLEDVFGQKYGELVSNFDPAAEDRARTPEDLINSRILDGDVMILVAHNVNNNTSGHVGIIRSVHRLLIDTPNNPRGNSGILAIDYTGWEATSSRGAVRVHKVWRATRGGSNAVPSPLRPYWTADTSGGRTTGGYDIHNGPFKDIHIIKLDPADEGIDQQSVLVSIP
jgi:hypothetical protein